MGTNDSVISGWAVRYNEPTTIAGLFVERIAPAAFAGSLDDVTLLWSHDHDRPLARTTSGTLTLRDEGGMGLWFSADLDAKNPDAAVALSSIGRLDTRGMSFGFRVIKEEWSEPRSPTGLPERMVLKAEISEISAVVWPAYRQCEVSVLRSESAATERAMAKMRARGIAV